MMTNNMTGPISPRVPLGIVELELWLPSHTGRGPLNGHEVAERCLRDSRLPREVVWGMSLVPDASDIAAQRSFVEEGERALADFEAFCRERGLPPDPTDAAAAAAFLTDVEGQELPWLHLPADTTGCSMALALAEWARFNGLQIRDSYGDAVLSDTDIAALWTGNG